MMKTSVFLRVLLAAVLFSTFPIQARTDEPVTDDDGILRIEDKPFDVNRFVIGRDFHENKFIDQDKGLQGMADCYFNMSDASDGKKQNLAFCKKLGLNTIISAQGKHLTGKDWMAMSDEEIEKLVEEFQSSQK